MIWYAWLLIRDKLHMVSSSPWTSPGIELLAEEDIRQFILVGIVIISARQPTGDEQRLSLAVFKIKLQDSRFSVL